MRRAVLLLVTSVVLAGGCGSSNGPAVEASTAAERARLEHAAAQEEEVSDDGKQWGGWRYRGSRDECFFVVGRTCFKEEKAACKAAKCGKGKCKVEGGGPATVSCAR